MEIMLDDFNTRVNSINLKLDTMSDHSTQSRKMISSQVEKIKEDYKKLESEVIGLSRKLKKVDEKVDQLPKE